MTNYSDRLSFDKRGSRQIHEVFKKGGAIKFRVIDIERPTTNYSFTIEKADWYENAYRTLQES